MKKKIMLVFGTRPEAIKMAPLVLELKKYNTFETCVCVTGQHREMLDQVLQIFSITPDYDLNIMKPGQDLYDVTSRVLLGMRDVLREVKPDVVLVHGDTTTSTAAALAAFYQQIPVGHVEAGLRTHNIYSPWPEEMNRQLTGRIASYNFSPTELSRSNLLNEGIDAEKITVTGNTVIDALHLVVDKISSDTSLRQELAEVLRQSGYDINRLNDTQRRLVLITGHRRENFGEGFLHICTAIKDLSMKYPNVDFVYPMHLNPNVRRPIAKIFEGNEQLTVNSQSVNKKFPNMFFAEPLEYLSFVYLMEKAYIVLTDSGGIQEEAPGLGKPVLVMRDTTERPEAVAAGTVKLVGTDYDAIVSNVSELLDSLHTYEQMSKAVNPYGDGKACQRIINVLKSKHTCE
ncbi:MAG: UDP-N-acetylglucosamine 2-epimerase (non-hydrolyzing) [Prevotella sp.]|nr:UDP-N-acetylglucosamine 2-epimerase (non-hydrolyzing) [Prevotella sp.]MBQ6681696.1 UDP-N-acetylglucosamine 2-epimerase (non-hydrolyzing) [Prevotella sp.]